VRHMHGVCALLGVGCRQGNESGEEENGVFHIYFDFVSLLIPTLWLRLVWGYLHFMRFVPSGLLKEDIYIKVGVVR
jgi:hypothetical protein